jgi:3-hydroxybutyryl-CoA dehydrogenase
MPENAGRRRGWSWRGADPPPRERKKAIMTDPIQSIERVAVLGAGTMGRGIAHVAALAGFTTFLYDNDGGALEKAEAGVHRSLARGVELGKVRGEEAEAARRNLRRSTDLGAAVAAADLVIEAVPENMALKVELFAEVVRRAPAHALLASNTSALSITEMAAATGRAARFAGMHFFNPVHLMKLIELVRGLETSEATLAALRAVGERMGKEVVVVREAPGFVTSRINALIGNEAFRMLQEGVASAEDIDKALKLGLNHPMGPFEMVDLVGLDVRLSILEFLHRTLGEAFRPNQLLVQHVRAGRLGRKVGRGVYSYDENGKRSGG